MGKKVIVADANLVVNLSLNASRTMLAQRVRKIDHEWLVPPLFRSEMLSVLGDHLRRKSLTRDQAIRAFKRACSLVEVANDDAHPSDVLNLLERSGCSSYDLEYVALAERRGIPLVTADKELLKNFPGTAWAYEQFIEQHH